MKRFLLLSAAAVITAATVNAQTVVTPVKHDMKILHKEDKVIRKEIRKEKKELRMSSAIKRKSVKFSGIGESTGTNSEPITMEEIHRIIMSDGFQYFAAAE